MLVKLQGNYGSKTIDTINTQSFTFDDEELLEIFIPSEIAIEVAMNYYDENKNICFDYNDIKRDIESYFDYIINNTIRQTIEIIRDYGNDVK